MNQIIANLAQITFLEKSLYFIRKCRIRLIRLFYFQNYRILSGQGIVQIKPNSVWSIPWAPSLKKEEFWL